MWACTETVGRTGHTKTFGNSHRANPGSVALPRAPSCSTDRYSFWVSQTHGSLWAPPAIFPLSLLSTISWAVNGPTQWCCIGGNAAKNHVRPQARYSPLPSPYHERHVISSKPLVWLVVLFSNFCGLRAQVTVTSGFSHHPLHFQRPYFPFQCPLYIYHPFLLIFHPTTLCRRHRQYYRQQPLDQCRYTYVSPGNSRSGCGIGISYMLTRWEAFVRGGIAELVWIRLCWPPLSA